MDRSTLSLGMDVACSMFRGVYTIANRDPGSCLGTLQGSFAAYGVCLMNTRFTFYSEYLLYFAVVSTLPPFPVTSGIAFWSAMVII